MLTALSWPHPYFIGIAMKNRTRVEVPSMSPIRINHLRYVTLMNMNRIVDLIPSIHYEFDVENSRIRSARV